MTPATKLGKVCIGILMLYVIVLITFVVGLFTQLGLFLFTMVMVIGRYVGIPAFLLSIIAMVQEPRGKKIFPTLTMLLSAVAFFLSFLLLYSYQFGG